MKILEELWYGDIRPVERDLYQNPEYSKLSKEILSIEGKLDGILSDEAKKELEKLTDIKSERALISESEAFASGFTLGARMMLEVMENNGSIQ